VGSPAELDCGRDNMEVWKELWFEAAHLLPNLPEGHKCRRLHGHSYRVRVYVSGDPDPRLGWVIDFADIKRATAPISIGICIQPFLAENLSREGE
jgi:6-pyruvoyl tetrahydropterin synthase/QueD family protein